jgi:circadian clock protein KaiB
VKKNTPLRKKNDKWALLLYIAGKTQRTTAAVTNLKIICENRLKDNYRIEVIDLLKNPQLARSEQIVALPTLVRKSPLPKKSIIGDLSNTDRVLSGLDLI